MKVTYLYEMARWLRNRDGSKGPMVAGALSLLLKSSGVAARLAPKGLVLAVAPRFAFAAEVLEQNRQLLEKAAEIVLEQSPLELTVSIGKLGPRGSLGLEPSPS